MEVSERKRRQARSQLVAALCLCALQADKMELRRALLCELDCAQLASWLQPASRWGSKRSFSTWLHHLAQLSRSSSSMASWSGQLLQCNAAMQRASLGRSVASLVRASPCPLACLLSLSRALRHVCCCFCLLAHFCSFAAAAAAWRGVCGGGGGLGSLFFLLSRRFFLPFAPPSNRTSHSKSTQTQGRNKEHKRKMESEQASERKEASSSCCCCCACGDRNENRSNVQ